MVKSEDFLPAASGLDGIEWTEDTPEAHSELRRRGG